MKNVDDIQLKSSQKITLTGIKLEEIIISKVKRNLTAAGQLVVSQAQRLVPVDTGRLLTSIQPETVKRSNNQYFLTVGSSVEYAAAVEYGTEKQKSKPYLRPAVNLQFNNIVDLFKDFI